MLQGISGTPSAYLWSPQSPVVVQDDHIYNNGGSAPTDYTASGLVGYLELDTGTGNVALRRYVNTTTGHHYYSTANDPPSGFVTDGILGYLRTAADSATVTLYRHYSAATGDYQLTTSSTPPTGYALQATVGYLYTTPTYDSGDHQDLAYHYDEVGNITAVVDNIFTASRIYTYDALNRLESAYGYFGQNQMEKSCTYSYSSIGNILDKCGVTFTYGDTNHPSAVTSISSGKTYSYDPNGNMATGGGRIFDWNVDNRVNSVSIGGSTTSMEYDYTGMRVKKVGTGGETLYPFAGYEIAPDGTVTKFIRIGTEIFASKVGASTKRFYHNDHLGGVNVITDIYGGRVQLNEYDPWGGVSRSEGTIDPDTRFTGQKLDAETGLYYYGGRYYDPEISRFISPDPFVQDPGDPQNLNRYSYVNNDPINYIDPSGYFYRSKPDSNNFLGIFGTIFGALVTIVTGIPTFEWAIGLGFTVAEAGAIAGGISGALGGAVSAGISGGNPLQGFLFGGLTGAALGYVGGSLFGGGGPLETAEAGPIQLASADPKFPIGDDTLPPIIVTAERTVTNAAKILTGVVTGQLPIFIYNTLSTGRQLANQAFREAVKTKLPGRSQGQQDAWRHARWNQLMAEKLGPLEALSISTAHEIFENGIIFTQSWSDFVMDMHNNIVGALSGEHPDALLSSGRLTTVIPRYSGSY